MNRDIIEGNWKQIRGKVKARWGRLTDNELEVIDGDYEALCGRIQRAYGWLRDQAQRDPDRLH